MGFRFRKSFKLFPGVRVNLSGKSAGIRFGGKHAGVSLNTKGSARASASIPGTGLSYSVNLGGKGKNKPDKKAAPAETNAACKVGYADMRRFVIDPAKNARSKSVAETNQSLTCSLFLFGNDIKSRQEFLRNLKFHFDRYGAIRNFSFTPEHISSTGNFMVSNTSLGWIKDTDLSWIRENLSAITKISSIQVNGGGTDIYGKKRPYVVEIKLNIDLVPGMYFPSFIQIELPPVKFYNQLRGDSVCWVSKSKKFHSRGCSSINIENCTPMLIEEAIVLKYESCGKCF